MVALARDQGFQTVFVPAVDAREAALVSGVQVIPVQTLAKLVNHLRGDDVLPAYDPSHDPAPAEDPAVNGLDLSHIRGQEHAKRALEIAAAGGHNLLKNWTAYATDAGTPG